MGHGRKLPSIDPETIENGSDALRTMMFSAGPEE